MDATDPMVLTYIQSAHHLKVYRYLLKDGNY